MSRHILARPIGKIPLTFFTVFIVVNCHSSLSPAQVRIHAPVHGSRRDSSYFHETGAQAPAVNETSLEEVLSRLEAAEAEIRSLRQQGAAASGSDIPGTTPGSANGAEKKHDEGTCECEECKEEAKKEPPKIAFLTPLSMGECGDLTFTPGLRLQPRYFYDDRTGNNDMFIRRWRLKAGGNAFDVAKYYAELKFDSNGRFEVETLGVIENAWLDFTVREDLAYLRVGLYDIPFSRNALTSDSKLLFMDRSLIKSALTTIGMADNTIGLLLHGRPGDGRFEYDIGIFDNVAFERFGPLGPRHSNQLMPGGRVVWNVLADPRPTPAGYADYRESYIGEGRRLAIGANSAYLGNATDNANEFNVYAWGVDVFYNSGNFVAQAEYDWFSRDMLLGAPDSRGDGWYVQAGYLLGCFMGCWTEVAGRYQTLDTDKLVFTDELRWSSVGFNFYKREHNLKVQMDYTFKAEQGVDIDNDAFQVQLQIDY